jgi:hypothetical protein
MTSGRRSFSARKIGMVNTTVHTPHRIIERRTWSASNPVPISAMMTSRIVIPPR